jgi:hypothetical protein
MYGNRLVRAYFGAARARDTRRPHWFTGFDFRDNVSMSQLSYNQADPHRRRFHQPPENRRLFHVVNVALNIVAPDGDRLEWQQRKAASFTVSPLHSGSAAVVSRNEGNAARGYMPSEKYSGEDGISLGRAMTISGAAASPNMGYHSSSAVAFVMTFFNVRLGWWLPNPGSVGRGAWSHSEPFWALRPLYWEALGMTTAGRPYVYLSDGGHFDNLGLYEMVRRRCKRIVVVDASADPQRTYGDLQSTLQKIRIDLGVTIDFPPGALDKSRRFAAAEIRYADADGTRGVLYCIKPMLSGDEPVDVQHYARESHARDATNAFPHQSTADQFFNEEQFESYRVLGLHSLAALLGSDGPVEWPDYEKLKATYIEEKTAMAAKRGEKADRCGCPAGAAGAAAAAGANGPGGGMGHLFSRLSGAAQSMGQGALVATAVTVGGVVGVTGAVALKDSTVSLKPGTELVISKGSMEELQKTKLGFDPPKVEIPDGKGAADVRLELKGALNELKTLLATQNQQNENVRRLAEATRTLEERLRDISKTPPDNKGDSPRAGAKGGSTTGDAAQDLTKAINDLSAAIARLPSELGKTGNPKDPALTGGAWLKDISDKLGRIEETTRRNVRGGQ